jgi:hypothetical protein
MLERFLHLRERNTSVRARDGRHAYTTDGSWSMDGFRRSEHPLCLVWKNPMTVSLPLNRYTPR